MTLSQPLILNQPTFDEKISCVIENFRGIFLDREKRPDFNGKGIYFEMSCEFRGLVHPYPEKLMHILSLEDKGQVDILPCNNDEASLICTNQCALRFAQRDFQFLQRKECFYRMSRIHWIPEIINLANSECDDIKIWEETEKDRGRDVTKTYIRYQKGLIDYLIILRHRKKGAELLNYVFDTAYPVFYQRSKKQYDKRFNENT